MPEDQIPGNVEPDGSADTAMRIMIASDVLERLIVDNGLCPTAEIRLTIAQEIHKFAPIFVEDTISRVAGLIKYSN